MKKIKLQFSTTDRCSSAFIRWAQRCEYSHIEAVFDDEGYSIGARSTGVKRYTEIQAIKYEYGYVECTDEQYEMFKDFLEHRVGDKYDFRAYLGLATYKRIEHPSRWFCSELMLAAFKHAGIRVIDRTDKGFCLPRDFLISPVVEKSGDVHYIGK